MIISVTCSTPWENVQFAFRQVNFTSLLLAVRTSMVTTASTKVTMITSTHNLEMSLRWKVLPFLLSRRDKLDCELAEFMTCLLPVKPYRIIFRPLRSVLKRVQRWVSWIRREGGGVTPSHSPYRYVPPQRIGFLGLFGLRMGIDKFCPFWSGIRYGFRGNYGSVWMY